MSSYADNVTKDNYTYSLKAFCMHIGPLDSGHYVAFSKRGE